MRISLNVNPWTVICKWKFRKLNSFYKCYKVGIEHAPRKWFGHRVNHSCFLVFHILCLSQKWPAGCGICTLEGNWAECGRKRLENLHHIPQSSRWPWPQVPHLPGDCVPLRHIPHQGWSMEATWKLKSLVLSLLQDLPLTVWSWTKPSSSLGSPWKWVFSAIEFCYLSSCWGKARSPHFFAIKPTFSSSLYSRTSLP